MWKIDTVRVFMQELPEQAGQIIPRLQPVGDKTVLQIFGYESDTYRAKMKIVGYTDHEALKAMAKDGVVHTVSGVGFHKDVLVKSFSSSRNLTVAQTIRPDLDCESPVFDVELELYYDN